MTPSKILIVDDELHIRRLLTAIVARSGYEPADVGTAREALGLLPIMRPDIVLLDLGLPDRDGLELIGPMRAGGAAVIVITARDVSTEKVAALDLGADDYVTKPFDTDELLARMRGALRRRTENRIEQAVVRVGAIEVDLVARIVRRDGAEVRLTPREYAGLAELAAHPGRVITHAQLLRSVWGPAHEHDVEYLRVAARGLRLKLEADPSRPVLIRNEPGIGYRLMAEG